MLYELGDYVDNTKEYFSRCILLTDFQKNVNIGDTIHTYRKIGRVDYIVREYIFNGFSDCEYQKQYYDSCRYCKGYILVIDLNNKHTSICPGYASGKESVVLKIIKNVRMDIFEEGDFEI